MLPAWDKNAASVVFTVAAGAAGRLAEISTKSRHHEGDQITASLGVGLGWGIRIIVKCFLNRLVKRNTQFNSLSNIFSE